MDFAGLAAALDGNAALQRRARLAAFSFAVLGGTAPVTYPAFGSPDFAVSGLPTGADRLGGTAAVVDEPMGDGRTIVFSVDPNFRAWTEGTQQILFNAILGPNP